MYRTVKKTLLAMSAAIAISSPLVVHAADQNTSSRPNVVVVLLDDAGFGASSTFGGPVNTPAAQQLAEEGLRYNRFHVTGISSPTRAALLTGRNAHRVGFGTVAEINSGYPGYDMRLKPQDAIIPAVLHRNGYTTAAFGKWHNTPFSEESAVGPFDRWPTGLGFDYFYGFLNGEANQWEPVLYRNTVPVDAPLTAEQGYNFTTDIANNAIRWIHESKTLAPNKPFFVYFAPGATHAPLHVAPEWITKYKGKFDAGWDELRKQTFARQKALGIIPQNAELTPRSPLLPAWNSYPPRVQHLLAHQMEVYAAFLEQTDHEVGRVIAEAKKYGGDNTLVFYILGDNGASGEGGPTGTDESFAWFIGADASLDRQIAHQNELGSVLWDDHYATEWAWAANTPFQFVKQMPSHLGAARDPLIVSWPAHIKDKGGLRSQFSHVNDIAPTIYEAAGISPPDEINGVKQDSLDGTSLLYSFDDITAPSRHTTQYFEVQGNLGIYKDGWWAGSVAYYPWQRVNNVETDITKRHWELYHLDDDYSQALDVAQSNPDKLAELTAAFDSEAQRNNVYPLLPNGKGGEHAPTVTLKHLEIPGDVSGIPPAVLPELGNSHRLTVDLDAPKKPAQGVIVAEGGRYGGFSLYTKNGALYYEINVFGTHHLLLKSNKPLPAGHATIEITFEKTGTAGNGPLLPLSIGASSGNVVLKLDGEEVAHAKADYFGAFFSSIYETFDIGRDGHSRVSNAYTDKNAFNGTVNKVVIDVL